MVNFLVSLLHESASTGVLQEEVRQPNRQVAQPVQDRPNPRNSRQNPGRESNPRWRQRGRERQRRARAARLGPNGDPDRRKTMRNAKNQEFWRSKDQISFIVQERQNRCLCCYRKGHGWAECTADPVRQPPPGYHRGWHTQQQPQQNAGNA